MYDSSAISMGTWEFPKLRDTCHGRQLMALVLTTATKRTPIRRAEGGDSAEAIKLHYG